jgi:O-antigen/teichoic acid export membrane protein
MNFISLTKKLPSHVWVAASGWFSRIIIGIVQLISIPIFYKQLGLDEFAVFTVITGLTAWYSLLDFGIGAAIQNFISEHRAHDKDPKELVASLLPLISLLIVIMGLVVFLFGSILEKWLFSHLPNHLSTFYFCLSIWLYCSYFILLIGNKILFAYRKGFLGYFYQSISYAILLIAMIVIQLFHIQLHLSEALLLWIIPLFLSGLIMLFHSFYQANARFNLFAVNFKFYKKLLARSGKFWFVAFSANGFLAIDYLVIVKMLSAKDVITYNIVSKIFLIVLFVYSAVLSAIWPILAEAYAKKTIVAYESAEQEIRRSILGGIIYTIVVTSVLIYFRQEITVIFKVQDAISLPVSSILLIGLYGCVRVILDTYSIALQARNQMKLFMWITPLQAIIAIPTMIYLARYGLLGVLGALSFSYIVLPFWLVPYIHYKSRNVI